MLLIYNVGKRYAITTVMLRRVRRMAMTSDFSEDLKRRYLACRLRGRANYCAAYVLLIGAVSCSALATLSVADEMWPKTVNAILAALPGILYLTNRQFRFEERSKWWFEKFYGIEGLYRGLVREGRDEAEISKALTLQSAALASRWPGFGTAPGH
jgi:hypothetical protein